MLGRRAVFAHRPVQLLRVGPSDRTMDGPFSMGAQDLKKPPWMIGDKEKAQLFAPEAVTANILCYQILLDSKTLTHSLLMPAIAHLIGYQPNSGASRPAPPSQPELDSIKKGNRGDYYPLAHLLGRCQLKFGLLVTNTLARQRAHIPLLCEPHLLGADEASSSLGFLGDQVLSVDKLQEVRRFHLSLMYLLYTQNLADPDSAAFREFCDQPLPLDLLLVPLTAASTPRQESHPTVDLQYGQVYYNGDERTFVEYSMLDCFLTTWPAVPYDRFVHHPGAILRTTYSPALYSFLDRTPGEGLHTMLTLKRELKPNKSTGDTGDPHTASNKSLALPPMPSPDSPSSVDIESKGEGEESYRISMGSYISERWGITDVHDQGALLLVAPLTFKVAFASDSLPTASRNVLHCALAPTKTAEDARTAPGRKLHPALTSVLPWTLHDANFMAHLPAILVSVNRRLGAMALHFDIALFPERLKRLRAFSAPPGGPMEWEYDVDGLDSPHNTALKLPDLVCLPPPLSLVSLEEALTLPSADKHNYERLETLGDTVLKFAVSTYLFMTMPNASEGEMSLAKSRLVSNRFLAYTARSSWVHDASFQYALILDLKKPTLRPRANIPMKGRADLCESTLAHFFLQCGLDGARAYLCWLDNDFSNLIFYVEVEERQGDRGMHIKPPLGWFTRASTLASATPPSSPASSYPSPSASSSPLKDMLNELVDAYSNSNSFSLHPMFLDPNFGQLPSLGYTFKRKHLLATAFTHTSAKQRPTGQTFERLEFLGDACLDMIFVAKLFHHSQKTPGQISELRASLTNNSTYAFLAVLLGLHSHLICDSFEVQRDVKRYLHNLHQLTKDLNQEGNLSCLLGHSIVRKIHIPAALADLFEAVAGAIFLDLDKDFRKFCQIFLPLIDPLIAAQARSPLRLVPTMELSTLMQKHRCIGLQIFREGGLLQAVWHNLELVKLPVTTTVKQDQSQLAAQLVQLFKERTFLWQEHCDCQLVRDAKSSGPQPGNAPLSPNTDNL